MRHTIGALAALAALAVLGAAVVGGCGGATAAQPASPSPSAPPPELADITGVVHTLTPGSAGAVALLVDADGSAEGEYDKAWVSVGPGASVWTTGGQRGAASDIAEGARVAVWFEGGVRESYPVQATAGAVQILAPD
jgi:hypothetical protein